MSPGISWEGATMKPPPCPTFFHQPLYFSSDFFRSPIGEQLLHTYTSIETKLAAVLLFNFIRVHHFGLEWIKYIQAQLDQFGEKRLHFTAGMNKNRFTRFLVTA